MRLIDADAFKKLWEGCTIEGFINPLIDARPTVDAIPIEFINKLLESARSLRITSKDIEEKENSIEIMSALETLIYLWRKENESNSDS